MAAISLHIILLAYFLAITINNYRYSVFKQSTVKTILPSVYVGSNWLDLIGVIKSRYNEDLLDFSLLFPVSSGFFSRYSFSI